MTLAQTTPATTMADPHAALPYAEAAALVAAFARELPVPCAIESVSLLEAPGRVLAEPVLADRPQPPFPRSTRDGFACRAADLLGHASLRVIGLLRAGEAWQGAVVGSGEAVEIMTGAPVPDGADCVVMIEHVDSDSTTKTIKLATGREMRVGDNVIPTGAEAPEGAVLVAAGTRLTASHLAAAASVGSVHLSVYRRPRVAILSTGDELVAIEQTPLAFQIRNSNSYSLAVQVLALGGVPLIQPVAGDTAESLDQAIRAALDGGCELLLLSGGVSMGKYDLVEGVLGSLGARFFFTGARIQPGKPVVFGDLGAGDTGDRRLADARPSPGLPFLGLPGNPVSTMVTFTLFASPVLAALAGERSYTPRFAEARLCGTVAAKSRLTRFLPAHLAADVDRAEVTPVSWQGSGDVAGTARANCLIVVPETSPDQTLPDGTQVRILFF